MPIASDFTSVLNLDWDINFIQCMPNGLLKYTELCQLMQLTAARHSELGGISFTDMQVHHQAWVLSRMRVEINQLPRWKDQVTIKTWINSLENSRSIRAMEIWVNDEKYVGAETFWAVFNTQTRRPEALVLPHEHYEKFPNWRATNKTFDKVMPVAEAPVLYQHKVALSDLDIVNHVNHVKYLEWCLDVLPKEILLEQKVKALDMNFIKELSWGDEIVVRKSLENHPLKMSIHREDSAVFTLALEQDF
ncbi:MAG: acyl-[acyl-carrier-protein] thioesterase [Bacteroidetes bacterium]|nr:acyl-[acyl-carrier-protein] thioesterase [Bacteroidota bacterium]